MRRSAFTLALLVVTIAWSFSASLGRAQNGQMATGEKPPRLLTGVSTRTHPISTHDPEAQKFFDQGLTLLYGFNRYEALRSFRRAAELDRGAAMAHWGVAMALGPHINMDLDGDVDMTGIPGF